MNKIMTKSIIKFLLAFVAAILVPTSVAAQFDDNNQFDQFGQSTNDTGSVCRAKYLPTRLAPTRKYHVV